MPSSSTRFEKVTKENMLTLGFYFFFELKLKKNWTMPKKLLTLFSGTLTVCLVTAVLYPLEPQKLPVHIRSQELSNVEHSKYLDG